MTTTATRASTAPIDLASLREVRRTYVEQAMLTWVVAEYQGHDAYTVEGFSDGSHASCSCPGFVHRERCKHATAWPLILEHLEQTYQATKSTADLIACLDFWSAQREPLTVDQRLAQNAQRAVLAARGVKYTDAIPLAARMAVVKRGREAKEELFS